MNNLENREILSEDILKSIDIILRHYPNAIFGGSIVLNALGLITRKINDIDIFVNRNTNLRGLFNYSDEVDSDFLSDTTTDINGNLIKRTGIKINGVKCCCFKVSDTELLHTAFRFSGRIILLQNVNNAIIAKREYAKKNIKHEQDLCNINYNLNKLLDE